MDAGAEIRRLEKVARGLINKHAPSNWAFRWAKRLGENKIAHCDFETKTLVFCLGLCLLVSDKEFEDTVLHEIAHALVGPDVPPHGKVWKKMARSLGVKLNAYLLVE